MLRLDNRSLLLFSTLLFTFLFYDQSLGLNLVFFELIILSYLLYDRSLKLDNNLHRFALISVVSTVVFTLLHHSLLSFFVNFLLFFLLIGFVSVPQIRSIPLVVFNSFSSLIKSQGAIKNELRPKNKRSKKYFYSLKRLAIFIIPLLIITTFILIYSASNPKFGEFFTWINTLLSDLFQFFFENIELNLLLVLIFGLMVSAFIFLRFKSQKALEIDAEGNDRLLRQKVKRRNNRSILALYNEYRAAVFLFMSLNLLLLFLNAMDIYWVWFNFKWEGQFLKEFVHQGTFLLLVSIILSIFLVLYFFRRNINFYSKNTFLKKLSYIWLFQNVILVISVGIRNWYYIQYYALAYKRIAIVFFLILTLISLYTVFKKISTIRSTYYMIRVNSFAFIVIITFSAAFNWDRIIAEYNFNKANRSFVHLNYLSTLADSALPFLDHPIDELKDMDTKQIDNFKYNSSSSLNFYKRTYQTPENYTDIIKRRKEKFKSKWEKKSFLSWNLAEHLAYHDLFE